MSNLCSMVSGCPFNVFKDIFLPNFLLVQIFHAFIKLSNLHIQFSPLACKCAYAEDDLCIFLFSPYLLIRLLRNCRGLYFISKIIFVYLLLSLSPPLSSALLYKVRQYCLLLKLFVYNFPPSFFLLFYLLFPPILDGQWVGVNVKYRPLRPDSCGNRCIVYLPRTGCQTRHGWRPAWPGC